MNTEKLYNIQEISAMVQVPASTLKEWRRNTYLRTFIPEIGRGAQRKHPENAIAVFEKIRDLRNKGISLKNIALVLSGRFEVINESSKKSKVQLRTIRNTSCENNGGTKNNGVIENKEAESMDKKSEKEKNVEDLADLSAAVEQLSFVINQRMVKMEERLKEVVEGIAAINTQGSRNMSRLEEELTDAWRNTAAMVAEDQRRVSEIAENLKKVSTREQIENLRTTLEDIKQAQLDRDQTIDNRISTAIQKMEVRRLELEQQQTKPRRWWPFGNKDKVQLKHLLQ